MISLLWRHCIFLLLWNDIYLVVVLTFVFLCLVSGSLCSRCLKCSTGKEWDFLLKTPPILKVTTTSSKSFLDRETSTSPSIPKFRASSTWRPSPMWASLDFMNSYCYLMNNYCYFTYLVILCHILRVWINWKRSGLTLWSWPSKLEICWHFCVKSMTRLVFSIFHSISIKWNVVILRFWLK